MNSFKRVLAFLTWDQALFSFRFENYRSNWAWSQVSAFQIELEFGSVWKIVYMLVFYNQGAGSYFPSDTFC